MDKLSQQDDVSVLVTGRRMRARLQSVRRSMTVGDLRLSLLDWMGPEYPVNPPVVILHGALQTAEGMANLASHLARRGRVVVPDLRGRGETAQPAGGYDPATMAADVAGMIEQLGIDRPVVIGRLHGGLVAYHLAAGHPGSISGLVIGDTVPEVTDGRAQQLIEMTRALPRSFPTLEDAYAFYQYELGLSLERALHDIPFDLRRARGGYTWRHNLEVVARIEEAALPRADWDVLAKLEAPTLILHGQRGTLSPEMARRMCDTIGGDCTIQTILASGRDVFLGGGAEQAFAAIDLFLLRLTDPGSAGVVPAPDDMHARALIEPLVRALNGHDADAVRALIAPGAEIEVIHDGQPIQWGDGALVDAVLGEVLADRPAAVFTVERFLASRREASVVLASRARPADGEDAPSDSLSVSLWFDVEGRQICSARIQIARIPA